MVVLVSKLVSLSHKKKKGRGSISLLDFSVGIIDGDTLSLTLILRSKEKLIAVTHLARPQSIAAQGSTESSMDRAKGSNDSMGTFSHVVVDHAVELRAA